MVAEENKPLVRKWFTYGSFMAIIGTGLFLSLDSLLIMALKSQLNLDPNGPVFQNWKVAPIPVIYKFYIMNVDNPRETLRGDKLRVSERGPYAFKQWRRKEIVGWAADKSTVTYYEYKKYDLDYDATIGSLDDEITTINPLVANFGVTISKLLKDDLPIPLVLSPFIYGAINGFFGIHREGLFTTQKVREILFGKRIPMIATIVTLLKPLDLFGIQLDVFPKEALPPNNTVGLLFGRNNTPVGPYEVYTGLAGDGPAFHFASWQGKKKLRWWKTEQCNMINGSDGELFGPGIKPEDTLYAFDADICRSLHLKYLHPSKFKGIPTYRYTLPDDFLVGIDKNQFNECFCMHKDRSKCRVDGMYDLGGCQFGAPLVITTPHFLYYPHLERLVDGLNPNEEDHGSVVEIQPAMGSALYGVERFMFAVRIESNDNIRAFGNIKNVYVPFVWVEESGGLNDELASQVRNSIVYPVRGARILSIGVCAGGVALIIAAFAKQRMRRKTGSGNGADYGENIYNDGNEKKSNNDGDTRINMSEKMRVAEKMNLENGYLHASNARRKPMIVGNWKMNVDKKLIKQIIGFLKHGATSKAVEIVIAVPSIYIEDVNNKFPDNISIAAQNCYKVSSGAYTGEISPAMLSEFNVKYIVLGHVERRNIFQEDDVLISEKIKHALDEGFYVIACIGEQIQANGVPNNKNSTLFEQLSYVAAAVTDWRRLVIVYDSINATRNNIAIDAFNVQRTHLEIRNFLRNNISNEVAVQTRILYGGCVNASNCNLFAIQNDIDGFIIGSAALTPDFIKIINSLD